MPKFRTVAACFLAFLFSASCNQPFDPRAPLQEQIVVFAILSTDHNSQYVRIEHSYMPSDFDPTTYTSDNSILNATVTIKDGNLTYRLRDTTLPRADTSRFKFPLKTQVLQGFTPEGGKSYELTVQSLKFASVSASVTLPARCFPTLGLSSPAVLNNPGSHEINTAILCNAVLAGNTKGYIGRLFVDYDVLKGNEWVEERAEVPLIFLLSDQSDLRVVTYPQMTPRPVTGRVTMVFTNRSYQATLNSIAFERYKTSKLIFNRVVFQFLQAEQNLYNYYNVAHAYRDPQSMRLDEPTYSNVAGGAGLVGAYTLDSLVQLLPENFSYNSR